MIPVSYIGDLSDYNQFVAFFKAKLKATIECGYIGNRVSVTVRDATGYYGSLSGWRRSKYDEAISVDQPNWQTLSLTDKISAPKEMTDDETRRFLYYAWGWIDRLSQANSKEMLSFIDFFDIKFANILNHGSALYKNVYKMFVNLGYESTRWNHGKLIEATGVKVCPYCNRVFVENVVDGTGSVRGQLDHFYPKERYPYLAISRYNLVPSCGYCNGKSGKGEKDPNNCGLVSPYELKDAQGIKFEATITSGRFLSLDHCAQSVSIKATSQVTGLSENISTFHLEAVYNTHTDYVAEMYFKYCQMKTDAYKTFTKKMLSKAKKGRFAFHGLSMGDWQRIVFGVYSDEKEYCKRPMSKFCMDMFNDFKDKGL